QDHHRCNRNACRPKTRGEFEVPHRDRFHSSGRLLILAMHAPSTNETGHAATIAVISRLVQLSSRRAWLVIVGFLLIAIISGSYFARHVVITTDKSHLMSSSLPWRQQELMIDNAFPQRVDRILVVIDAATPEAADDAADALVNELSQRSEVIRAIER